MIVTKYSLRKNKKQSLETNKLVEDRIDIVKKKRSIKKTKCKTKKRN